MRRRARVDANHAAVTQALRSAGWTVIDTSRLGNGFADLVAIRRGDVEFIEVKDGGKVPSAQKLTPDEVTFHELLAAAGVTVKVIRNVNEAISL